MNPPSGPRFNPNQYVVDSTNTNHDYCEYIAPGPVSDCSPTSWNNNNGSWESTVCLQCSVENQCRFSSERGTRNVVCTKIEKSFNDGLEDVPNRWQARFENVWGFFFTDSSSDCGEWREVRIVLDCDIDVGRRNSKKTPHGLVESVHYSGRSPLKKSELIWRFNPGKLQHRSMGFFRDWAMERGFELIFELDTRTTWTYVRK